MRERWHRVIQIHGTRTALQVYLVIAIGVFTSVIALVAVLDRR